MRKLNFYELYERITESGCWIWIGATTSKGYGMVRRCGVEIKAHRYSWEIHKGAIENGLFVLHRCDVKCCVNPNHLFLGTNADNIKDAANKGKMSRKKERNNILTQNLADEMRELNGTGLYTQVVLAAKFKVGQSTVSRTLTRRSW